MTPDFERCVRALAETMVEPAALAPDHDAAVTRIADFMLATHAGMPDYLRLAFRILTLVFDAWAYGSAGKPFHQAGRSQRLAQVAAWEASRLTPRRALVVFYRTFATYGVYCERYERADAAVAQGRPAAAVSPP